jgi:GST-like protein
MIDLYTWTTPNGFKISIALEEMGLDYNVHPVDIGGGEQFAPEYLRISPNNKIPAIVDHSGPGDQSISIFESGAILLYLAEKTGRFLGAEPRQRWLTMQWLMFQMGSLGPMLGQAGHFRNFAPERVPYGIERYTSEAGRLFKVLDTRLGESEYLAEDYSIADIACWPWVRPIDMLGHSFDDYPNLGRWFDTIADRPAVSRGLAVPKV